MFGVGGHLQESGRDGAEEQIVEDTLVPESQRVELLRKCEYHMEVAGREKLPFAVGQPALARLGLTLRTVAVAA
jgi:hypothetical protein